MLWCLMETCPSLLEVGIACVLEGTSSVIQLPRCSVVSSSTSPSIIFSFLLLWWGLPLTGALTRVRPSPLSPSGSNAGIFHANVWTISGFYDRRYPRLFQGDQFAFLNPSPLHWMSYWYPQARIKYSLVNVHYLQMKRSVKFSSLFPNCPFAYFGAAFQLQNALQYANLDRNRLTLLMQKSCRRLPMWMKLLGGL